MRALIYGPENPMLSQQHGYTFVTPEAFESPVFRVLLDLHDRKRAATGALDLEKAAARYTMTVAQAAERLGVRDSAIRTAVGDGRLPAWMVDGEIRLDPASVDSYKVSRRGPSPKLMVAYGEVEGASLSVRVDGGEREVDVTSKERGVVNGEISQWRRVEVIASGKRAGEDPARYWAIAPGGPQRRIEVGDLKVAGRFTVTDEQSGKAARDAWAAARAGTPKRKRG